MNEKICYIICAGENYGLDISPNKDDLIIAADGGLKYLKEANIQPDIVIGDFDSLGYAPTGENIIKLNTDKDATDTYYAVEKGFDLGYRFFRIYCGTGGRIDHTVSNIQLLSHIAEKGGRGEMYDKDSILTAVKNGEFELSEKLSGYISVFSLSDESHGVYLENLKYELQDGVLTSTFSLGTSNEFVGKRGKIKVGDGTLLVVYPGRAF